MPKLLFKEKFDYVPKGHPRLRTVYKPGRTYTVNQECAEQAIKAGVAEPAGKKDEKDGVGQVPSSTPL